MKQKQRTTFTVKYLEIVSLSVNCQNFPSTFVLFFQYNTKKRNIKIIYLTNGTFSRSSDHQRSA